MARVCFLSTIPRSAASGWVGYLVCFLLEAFRFPLVGLGCALHENAFNTVDHLDREHTVCIAFMRDRCADFSKHVDEYCMIFFILPRTCLAALKIGSSLPGTAAPDTASL